MLSAGILTPLASRTALRRRGLPSASPPPIRAAIVISLMSLVNMRPRLASMAPFLCLMLCHLEWPDIDYSFICAIFRLQSTTDLRGRGKATKKRNSASDASGVRAGNSTSDASDAELRLTPNYASLWLLLHTE